MSKAQELADELTEQSEEHREIACCIDMRPEDSANWRHHITNLNAAAELRRLDRVNAELRSLLADLHAIVWGECPSLLNEDSGGNSALDVDIRAALTSSGDHL